MALAAHDPTDRADQLLGVTLRLTDLVRAEIDALKTGHLDASSRDWQEKEKLAHAYRLEMALIQQDRSLLEGVPQPLIQELMGAVQTFQQVLDHHAQAIGSMKDVTEGLVRTISEEVASARAAPAGYGAAGTATKPRDSSGSGIAANVKV